MTILQQLLFGMRTEENTYIGIIYCSFPCKYTTFLWWGVRKKLSINNGKGDSRRLSSGKETDNHVHTCFVLFHHNDGGGDFGGGVDHACPIPGPDWKVVQGDLVVWLVSSRFSPLMYWLFSVPQSFLPNLVDIGPLVVKKMINMLNVYDDDNKNNI